jgi:hypothetical protein
MFALIVGIIQMAFVNFFFIINMNQPGTIPERTGNKWFDAWLYVYLLSLGEFGDFPFTDGRDTFIVYFMFILGTFVILVVFMNMLIAIMGDTFGNV